jgi:hypothetical protein
MTFGTGAVLRAAASDAVDAQARYNEVNAVRRHAGVTWRRRSARRLNFEGVAARLDVPLECAACARQSGGGAMHGEEPPVE